MDKTEIAIRQAELMIRLYELRRDPVMRLARKYVRGRFLPTSLDCFLTVMGVEEQSANGE